MICLASDTEHPTCRAIPAGPAPGSAAASLRTRSDALAFFAFGRLAGHFTTSVPAAISRRSARMFGSPGARPRVAMQFRRAAPYAAWRS